MKVIRRLILVCVAVLYLVIVAMPANVYAQPLRPGVVLSMGDSYIVGVPARNTVTNFAGCQRQSVQAGRLVADRAGLIHRSVACAGATVQDMFDNRSGEGSQLNAIAADVSVILLSMGGNDAVGPSTLAATCILPFECTDNSPAVRNAVAGLRNLWNPVTKSGELADLYNAIKRYAAADTKVLVSGYGVTIAETPAGVEFPTCKLLVSRNERQLINRLVAQMNDTIRQAAEHFGFTYVDQMTGLVPGTGLCAPYGTPGKTIAAMEGPIPFHPTIDGVFHQADQYVSALSR